MLYEALTGRLPFSGSPFEVLKKKQQMDGPRPSLAASGMPEDLDALCARLLCQAPRRRPSGAEILRTLKVSSQGAAEVSSATPFVGRVAHLDALAQALDHAQKGQAVVVQVVGESGVGKTTLVREFLRRARESRVAPVVLSGRCYEHETVPYKGVDGVVDALCVCLRRLENKEVAALMPRRVSLLCQLFPVLLDIEVFAEVPAPLTYELDPQEARLRAFKAFRELLSRLCERHAVIIHIDDAHWMDADSTALMTEVLRPPDAPPILFILSARASIERARPGRAGDDWGQQKPPVRVIPLGPLSSLEAAELARRLMAYRPFKIEPKAIAEEARGHPLFIRELVRHALAGGSGQGPRLDDVILGRLRGLDPVSRSLLELLAVGSVPAHQELLAFGTGLEPRDLESALERLRDDGLVVTAADAAASGIHLYHERIREVIVRELEPDARRNLHARIARCLEHIGPIDPELVAMHWSESGAPAKAMPHIQRAAEKAAAAFAFERAARLYATALERHGDGEPPLELVVGFAEALANAGRGVEAADNYLDAARRTTGLVALGHLRRAADQLLKTGDIDRGLEIANRVLTSLSTSVPSTPVRALGSLLCHRALLWARGLAPGVHRGGAENSKHLLRIDVFWSLGVGLGLVDHVRAADFYARCLWHALREGDTTRVARGMAVLACLRAGESERGLRAAPVMLARASVLAKTSADPVSQAWVVFATGITALQAGRFAEALESCERAAQLFRDCVGATWEVAGADAFTLWSLAYLGRMAEVGQRVPPLLRETLERGNRFALNNLVSGPMHLLGLAADEPEETRQRCDDAILAWSQSGFHFQHLCHLFARTQIELYEGKSEEALARLEQSWPAIAKALMLRVQFWRVDLSYLRARAILAAAHDGHIDRRHARARVSRLAAVLGNEGVPWASAFAAAVSAGAASLRGDDGAALSHIASAHELFLQAGMSLHAAAAAKQWGTMLGGDLGRKLVSEATEIFAVALVKRPDRLTTILVPPVASV
jgi:tetratricopeptide (TPR) repeat protein